MRKILFSSVAFFCFLLLTSCSLEMSSTRIKQIKEAVLIDGSKTRIGYTEPDPSWKCSQLYRKSDSWGVDKMKGMLGIGGPYQILQEQAIEYANQKHLTPNYIYLHVPNETSVNGFNLHPFAEADAIYYQCKYPPAVSNKIF